VKPSSSGWLIVKDHPTQWDKSTNDKAGMQFLSARADCEKLAVTINLGPIAESRLYKIAHCNSFSGLGISRDAGGIVVGRSRDQPRPKQSQKNIRPFSGRFLDLVLGGIHGTQFHTYCKIFLCSAAESSCLVRRYRISGPTSVKPFAVQRARKLLQ
jgi:hypothetical protein